MPINTNKALQDVMGSVLAVKVAGEMDAQKQVREAELDSAELTNVSNLLGNEDNKVGEGSKLATNLETANSDRMKAEKKMNEAVAKQGTASTGHGKGSGIRGRRSQADIDAENLQYDQDAATATENYNQANDAYNQANDAMNRMVKQREAWEKTQKALIETIAYKSKKREAYANRMNFIRYGGNE